MVLTYDFEGPPPCVADYAMRAALYYVKAAQRGATIPRLQSAQAVLEAALGDTKPGHSPFRGVVTSKS